MSAEPYAVTDVNGHELMVLGATYTIVTDIGRGQTTLWAEPADYDEAELLVLDLASVGIRADIEVELDAVDLTAASYSAFGTGPA